MKAKATKIILTAILAIVICSICLCSCFPTAKNAATIVGAQINGDGELVVTYSDGTSESLGRVVGEDGADGKDGADGADGKDGTDGKDGADGTDGIDGKDGADGKDGKDGELIISDSDKTNVAAAKGIRSAVRVRSNFIGTVYNGYYPVTATYAYEGSGVIYKLDEATGDAYIITNYHVVYDSSSNTEDGVSEDIELFLYGSEYASLAIPAEYVGGSMYYDIAVLRVEDSELLRSGFAAEVSVADSEAVSVGDVAIAIGNPESSGISVCSGVVSVDSEYITMTAVDESTTVTFRVMRIDTAINSGNSGGGLFDSEGRLIGIVNAKASDSSVENIGYAIPSRIAVAVADNVIDNCNGADQRRVKLAVLGVDLATTDSRAVYDAQSGKISIVESVAIYELSASSLAAGLLEVGDILLSVKIGTQLVEITRSHQLIDFLLTARAGDEITFTVLRDGSTVERTMTISEDRFISY